MGIQRYFCDRYPVILNLKSNQYMKKVFLSFVILLATFAGQSQIVFENNYPGSATLTRLAISGDKYYMMDWTNNKCKIYNTDHSLWKTLDLTVPTGWYLYDIRYVSETLFNLDSKVELVYVYYNYNTTLQYYTYATKVINEDGSVLLTVQGGGYSEVATTSGGNLKFLVYVYDYSVSPYTVNTQVYSIPGQLVSAESTPDPQVRQEPFPNPSRSTVTIPFSIPEGASEAVITLTDWTGRTVKTYPVNQSDSFLRINTSGMPRGLYHYQVQASGNIFSTGKIIFE